MDAFLEDPVRPLTFSPPAAMFRKPFPAGFTDKKKGAFTVKFTVKAQGPAKVASQAVIVSVFEGMDPLEGGASRVDAALSGTLVERLKGEAFQGKRRQVAVLDARGALPCPRVAVFGLGKKEEFHPGRFREGVAGTVRALRERGVSEAALSLDPGALPAGPEAIARAAAEGALLGLYRFDLYREKDDQSKKELKSLVFLEESRKGKALAEKGLEAGKTVAEAVLFARDLVNMPANEMTPGLLARRAADMAKGRPLKVTVLDRAALKKMNMNALLAVSKGSDEPPKLILAEYRGGGRKTKPVVLVGKGVTFDSGGISLKPAERMHEMKGDMAGGAAVLAVLRAAADLGLPLNVSAVVPAAENLPGGRATRPGDVVRSLRGKSIEIINTDAEGRLLLADALAYAERLDPEAVIDVATLTGACVVALGPEVAGVFGNDSALVEKIRKASEETGEPVWELPLYREYGERLKSDTADLKNTGGREGGAVTAALFLENFVGKVPWAHLDIAGPAFSTKDRPDISKGGTGFSVRLLVELLQSWTKGPAESGGGR